MSLSKKRLNLGTMKPTDDGFLVQPITPVFTTILQKVGLLNPSQYLSSVIRDALQQCLMIDFKNNG